MTVYRSQVRSLRLGATFAVVWLCAVLTSVATAQVARTGPESGNVLVRHSLTNDVQPLPAVYWRIQNSAFSEGCIVQWTARSFELDADPAIRADCDLSVAIDGGTRTADWRVATAFDETRTADGDESATVNILSSGPGAARVSLQLRFRQEHLNLLPAGHYHTTLTGTVSGL